MDERARHANVYAMRAHAARNLPLISAAHHRALQLILATEANDIRLSPQQRRNARTLQQHYQQQYVDTCLHRNSINDTNSKSKSKNVDNADKERDKQNDMDWEMDQNNSNSSSSNNNGGGGSDSMDKNRDAKECIVSRVSALVDKALEMKRTKRGYVSAVQSSIKREANLSDYTICLTDIATLSCEPELDLLPAPETLPRLIDRSNHYKRQNAAQTEVQNDVSVVEIAKTQNTLVTTNPLQSFIDPMQQQQQQQQLRLLQEQQPSTSITQVTELMPTDGPSPTNERSGFGERSLLNVGNNLKDNQKNHTISTINAQRQQQLQSSQHTLTQQPKVKPRYATYEDEDNEMSIDDPRSPLDFKRTNDFNGLDRPTKKKVRTERADELGENGTRPMNFITAKEQMVIEEQQQEEKKANHYSNRGGFNAPTSNPYNNYGNNTSSTNTDNTTSAILKSRKLGTKRAKFKPPLNVGNNSDNNGDINMTGTAKSPSKADEPVDERLRNIDPKMIEAINNEIMESLPGVTWDDISGLEHAKKTIKETITWPMLRPDIFTGLRRPPKGLLLFGPPGTGKTMIGKCIASQSKATFFSISSSSLTSKWVGDGEKMVRALFAVARCHQPAVIFMDEIDSLLTQRSDGEVEASRRIKTEFLVQFDGVGVGGEEDRILIVGATNRPQEIDEAARRRFQKRLYIPLPENRGRHSLMMRLLEKQAHNLTPEQIQDICDRTEGYSGSDMSGLCREAALGPVRAIQGDILEIGLDALRPINHGDFLEALSQVRASVSDRDLDLYREWDRDYGSVAKS